MFSFLRLPTCIQFAVCISKPRSFRVTLVYNRLLLGWVSLGEGNEKLSLILRVGGLITSLKPAVIANNF